jgi:hypothetical protein
MVKYWKKEGAFPMETTKPKKIFVPKYCIDEANDVVFSLPEYDYDEKLEYLLKRVRENWNWDIEPEKVKAALDEALETF